MIDIHVLYISFECMCTFICNRYEHFFYCYEIMAWDSPNDKSRPGRVILNAKIQPEYMYININI